MVKNLITISDLFENERSVGLGELRSRYPLIPMLI